MNKKQSVVSVQLSAVGEMMSALIFALRLSPCPISGAATPKPDTCFILRATISLHKTRFLAKK